MSLLGTLSSAIDRVVRLATQSPPESQAATTAPKDERPVWQLTGKDREAYNEQSDREWEMRRALEDKHRAERISPVTGQDMMNGAVMSVLPLADIAQRQDAERNHLEEEIANMRSGRGRSE